MSKIFLSHSSQDNAIAEQVKARLEEWGHRSVFLDFDPDDGIPAGRYWKKELYAKLHECQAVIILCSHASMASRWCFAEVTHADAIGKHVFPIQIDDSVADPILIDKQVINVTAGWDQAYRRLEKGLLAAGLDPKNLFDWDGTRPPYPGLLALQEQDAPIFFGREKEIREGLALLNRLRDFGGPPITLMLGASGSGKSSLMRAGLLPRLKRDPQWLAIDPFRPLKAPFDELARVLSQRFSQVMPLLQGMPTHVGYVQERMRWRENDTTQVVEAFLLLIEELREKAGSRESTVLMMIDQCEELLVLGGANEEGDRFLAFLRALLARPDGRLMLLATVRPDVLGSFYEYPALRGVRYNTIQVPQMKVDDFASLIEGPAERAGLKLGQGIVQAMIHDTETSDALPLLAFTLRQLYDGYGDDGLLTLEEYRDELGGLDGCIARAAEAVLSAKPLSEKELSDLQTALLAMVRVNDRGQYAKQPVQWKDMPPSIHELLERFVTARLMTSSSNDYGRTLEVAHEALLRDWPRLTDWLKDNRSFLVWQERLRVAIRLYRNNNGKSDFLYRGFQLAEALDWLQKKPDSLSPEDVQFIMAGQRQKLQKRMMVCTLVGLMFLLMTGTYGLALEGYRFVHIPLKVQSLLGKNIHIEPTMVQIPGGEIQMGDVEYMGAQLSKPVTTHTIKPFGLSAYEVTFKEYDRFAIETGANLPSDRGWGRDDRPVINVSWDDAKKYADWLSEKTGKRYRLPSGGEWEYAARSGDKQHTWAGTSEPDKLEAYAVFDKNSQKKTAVVGQKKPNSFGLYDMTGNVFEWVEDCYHDAMPCSLRVIRGGSYLYEPEDLHVTSRDTDGAENRDGDVGFRLALDRDAKEHMIFLKIKERGSE
ncbi:MAG: SUMF1/EgtB/PvdO family nonheme iron enzyme [Nitrospira sp.]|nr:SUMF1/EgtB/PvdO family nonheme iron enzyme [Nitrospira sp.]